MVFNSFVAITSFREGWRTHKEEWVALAVWHVVTFAGRAGRLDSWLQLDVSYVEYVSTIM